FEGRIHRAAARGAQGLADAAPGVRACSRRRREGTESRELCKLLMSLAGLGGCDGFELRVESRSTGHLQRILQTVIEVDALEERDDGALEAGALFSVDVVRRRGLTLDFVEVRREGLEREIAGGGLLQPEEAEHLRIVDHEHRLFLGDTGPEHDVEQPLVGTDRPAEVLEALLTADAEERVPRHGVDRLDSPTLENGDAREFVEVETANLRGRQQR